MAGHPTSAQVMISWSVSSSLASGSVLTARSLDPASDSVSPSLSAPPLLMLCLSVSKINKNIKIKKKKKLSDPSIIVRAPMKSSWLFQKFCINPKSEILYQYEILHSMKCNGFTYHSFYM